MCRYTGKQQNVTTNIPIRMSTIYPFARPLYVMSKAAGPACNLRCEYCYYLEKQHLLGDRQPVMTDELLEVFVRDYIQLQQTPDILFTWHGGEPMLRPLDFYRKAVRLQRYYGRGKRISNVIQTNGTLLTDEWCEFLHDEGWLVGISIDGTKEMHDAYRVDAHGQGTWSRVMRGVELLHRHGVEWNAMPAIHHHNVGSPKEFYRFFRDQLECRYIQFSPVVERLLRHSDGRHLAQVMDDDCPVAPFSVKPREWGDFLVGVFDEWVRHDVGETFVPVFDATLACWLGMEPGICVYARECGHAVVMENNGDVYCCDHFVFPEYRLGNIRTSGLPQMVYGEKQDAFSTLKAEALPHQCRQCRWLRACNGECPRLRFAHTADGEPGLNYLCAGYRIYFQHVAPYMDYMAGELSVGRPASSVMGRRF